MPKKGKILAACIALLPAIMSVTATEAAPIPLATSAGIARTTDAVPVYVRRGGAVRTRTMVGPRGAVYRSRTVRRGAVVRPGWNGGGVRWARPGWYRWPVGGAIAAGAAIGVVGAATAAAWAGPAPAPGMCWYYTDPSRRDGFWDYCR